MRSPWRNPSIPGRGSRRVWLALLVVLGSGGTLAARGGIASRYVLDAVVAAARARGFELEAARATLGWNGAVTLAAVHVKAPGITAEADRLSLGPRWAALARGRRELAVVRIDDAVVDLDADALSAGALRDPPRGSATHDAGRGPLAIAARGLRARIRASRLPVTTWTSSRLDAVVRREGGEPSVTAEVVLPSGAAATATLELAGGLRGRASVRDLRWEDLPAELRDALGVAAHGPLTLDMELDCDAEMAGLRLAARAASADLTLSGDAVGTEPVGPLALRGAVALGWSRSDGRVTLDEATLEIGPGAELVLRARGDARLVEAGPVHGSFSIVVPDTARLVAVLPGSLRPPAGAPPLAGGLTGEVVLEGPWGQPLDWTVRGKLDLGAMRAAARARPASPLASSFAVRLTGADGREREVVVGPESADFVPLDELPSVVVDAVVTSEDGGFRGHQGFDFDEIERSVVAVAAAGRAVRGGSTISQQLAKNLFLTREKTFARKVREALVTLGLESSLSKARLLEIYLNVIEWGPDIRGIGPAARAYFDEDARALTAREAAYLASIIPNPVRYYAQYERRELSAAWGARLDTILTHMTLHGRLDAASYARALREPIVFRD